MLFNKKLSSPPALEERLNTATSRLAQWHMLSENYLRAKQQADESRAMYFRRRTDGSILLGSTEATDAAMDREHARTLRKEAQTKLDLESSESLHGDEYALVREVERLQGEIELCKIAELQREVVLDNHRQRELANQMTEAGERNKARLALAQQRYPTATTLGGVEIPKWAGLEGAQAWMPDGLFTPLYPKDYLRLSSIITVVVG